MATAAKWKYILIDEEGAVHGTDEADQVMKFFREAEASGEEVLGFEVTEEGVFQLSYSSDDEGGEDEGEEKLVESLERVEIEAL